MKYSEVIAAWIDGADVQFRDTHGVWVDMKNFTMHIARENNPAINDQWRIKPIPKPNVVAYLRAAHPDDHMRSTITTLYPGQMDNIRATFDGETGELKAVELLK